MSDLSVFQKEVGEWGNRTFPDSDNDSITNHLTDEVEELAIAAHIDHEGIGNIEEEAADCLLLLLHLAHRNGFDLLSHARSKHGINQGRSWESKINGRGYVKHTDPRPQGRAMQEEDVELLRSRSMERRGM